MSAASRARVRLFDPGFAGFWPTQTGPWADLLNPMPKYVVSRKPLGKLEWNATAAPGTLWTSLAA